LKGFQGLLEVDGHAAFGQVQAEPNQRPLRIPYGNKETAQELGARYRAGGWFVPPLDLSGYRERGRL